MKASEIRELLKLLEQPDIISLANGYLKQKEPPGPGRPQAAKFVGTSMTSASCPRHSERSWTSTGNSAFHQNG
jgi:hypothetical protein